MGSGVVELAFDCPEFLAESNPVVRHVVTHVVFFLRHAEHGNLSLIPARHYIEAKAATGNMIDSGDFLGGSYGMYGRDMKRCKYSDFFGFRCESGSPGKCLEVAMIEIDSAAHAFPAGHRNDGLNACLLS